MSRTWPQRTARPGIRTGPRLTGSLQQFGMAGVPGAWIDQTVPGGKILVPLDLVGSAGLMALLTVDSAGIAQGPFLSDYGAFMPLRDQGHQTAMDVLATVGDHDADTRETGLPVAQVTNAAAFEFFAALVTGGFDTLGDPAG